MTEQRPERMTHSRPPTLRLDNQRAWRQSENAVIIPIVYDSTWLTPNPAEAPVVIASVSPPQPPPPLSPTPVSEIPDWPNWPNWPDWPGVDEEEERRLAALKRKADSEEFQLPVVEADEVDSFFIINPALSFSDHAKHLSTAVPLLLLGGIALVVFAWVAFR